MLGMDFIKANRPAVEKAIVDKCVAVSLDEVVALDSEVRALKTEIEGLRASRNAISARFKDASPDERAALGAEAKAAGSRASELEGALAEKEAALKAMMLKLPGIPWEGAPVGPNEDSNVVIRTEGKRPRFTFDPIDHVALIEKNDWAELSRIAVSTASRLALTKSMPSMAAAMRELRRHRKFA